MRINFILPRTTNVAMGGYKIIFQYANLLATEYEHDVHIYFVINAKQYSITGIKTYLAGLTTKAKTYRRIDWFKLNPNIHLHFDVFPEKIMKLRPRGVLIATHWSTAKLVVRSKFPENKSYYFIQDYEVFDPHATEKQVIETWKLPLKKIVISNGLKNLGLKLGVSSTLIPNFINLNEFPIRSFSEQSRNRVTFLWHVNQRKQSWMGLEILADLHKRFPQLQMTTFGAHIDMDQIPNYVEAYENVSASILSSKIYAESLVYFMPSSFEGWGLTGLEAMASGAPVVSVNNGGINEYAENNKSALIVPNNKDQLESAIIQVIEDVHLQEKISRNGNHVAEEFSFEISGAKLNKLLTGGDNAF